MNDIKINLGQSYPVRFEVNSICSFEEVHGQSIMSVLGSLFSGDVSMLTLRNLLWCALAPVFSEKEENLTPHGVGILIQDEWISKGKTAKDLTKVILLAMQESGLITNEKSNTKNEKKIKKSKQLSTSSQNTEE